MPAGSLVALGVVVWVWGLFIMGLGLGAYLLEHACVPGEDIGLTAAGEYSYCSADGWKP